MTGGGTLTAYMLVNSVYDLQNIQNNLTGTYALGKDIDASATVNWNAPFGFIPIGSSVNVDALGGGFIGTLDGQNHTIDQLNINTSFRAVNGLFGHIGNTGIVRNIGLTNVTILGAGNALPTDIGALAGKNMGAITNSYTSGTMTIDAGAITILNVGGLVGENLGTISKSHSNASVVVNSGQFITAGGLVGTNFNEDFGGTTLSGRITESYATGSVSASSNNASLNGGRLAGTGGVEVGGLVGASGGNGISKSYATGSVSGTANSPPGVTIVGGLVGSLADSVTQSYSTGTVSGGVGGSGLVYTGGLVGTLQAGSISQSYSTSTVNAGAGSYTGGLVGEKFSGSITQSYAAGQIVSGPFSGGLVGVSFGGSAAVASYWDMLTTGQMSSAEGTGVNTSQLKAGLPTGFDPTVWASNPTINSGYPHLLWQDASSTPPITTTTLLPATSLAPAPSPTPNPVPSPTPTPNPAPQPTPTPPTTQTPSNLFSLAPSNSPYFMNLAQARTQAKNLTPQGNSTQSINPNVASSVLPYAAMSSDAYGNTTYASNYGFSSVIDSTAVFAAQSGSSYSIDAKNSGFYAMTFVNVDTKQLVVAFRGTRVTNGIPNSVDAATDVDARIGITPTAYQLATIFAQAVAKTTMPGGQFVGYSLILTGHSLGGAEASYAGSFVTNSKTITFEAARNPASELNGGVNQTNVVVPGDAIGAQGNSVSSAAASVVFGAGNLNGTTYTLRERQTGWDVHNPDLLFQALKSESAAQSNTSLSGGAF